MQQQPYQIGGNVATLSKLIGIKIPSEEFTMPNYLSTSGVGLIALQMIMDFDKGGSTPLLKPDVSRVGISVMVQGSGEEGAP
jgi:hypothetical protein